MRCHVIFVTGGSAGIGLATAQWLMGQGACVYAASRRGVAGDTLQDATSGGQIIPVAVDVNDTQAVQQVVQQIVAQRQRLDAVVCCAGNGIAGAVEDTAPEEAHYQFQTNFFGTNATINACLPLFRQQRFGRIVTISSVAAVIPIPYQTFYSAVKAAVLLYSQALSLEVKPFGLQCCCLLPGDVKTAFTASRKYVAHSQDPHSAYFAKTKASVGKMEHDEQNGMAPEYIAKAIGRVLNRRRMPPTCVPRMDYKLFVALSRMLPRRLMLWIVGKVY